MPNDDLTPLPLETIEQAVRAVRLEVETASVAAAATEAEGRRHSRTAERARRRPFWARAWKAAKSSAPALLVIPILIVWVLPDLAFQYLTYTFSFGVLATGLAVTYLAAYTASFVLKKRVTNWAKLGGGSDLAVFVGLAGCGIGGAIGLNLWWTVRDYAEGLASGWISFLTKAVGTALAIVAGFVGLNVAIFVGEVLFNCWLIFRRWRTHRLTQER